MVYDLNLKEFNFNKSKIKFRNCKLAYMCQNTIKNSKTQIEFEQNLAEINVNFITIKIKQLYKIFTDSIYFNLKSILSSNFIIIKLNCDKKLYKYNGLINLKNFIILLSLKLNNKIYGINELSFLDYFGYVKNIELLINSLKFLIKHKIYLYFNRNMYIVKKNKGF